MANPDLQPRGAALWKALGQDLNTPAGAVALEACRTADRLDELDRIIQGKGVLELLMFRLRLDFDDLTEMYANVNVKIDVHGVLSEARQQAGRLAHLLDLLGLDAKPSGGSGEGENPLAQVLALVDGPKSAGRSARSPK